MDADEPEPVRLTTEAKALLGVAAALALGAVTALAATFLRKRSDSRPAERRKPAARKSTRRTAAA
jgi:hypothetical protein